MASRRREFGRRVGLGIVAVLLLAGLGFGPGEIGGHPGFAQGTWQGFAVSGIAGPSSQVVSGGHIEIRFQAWNGSLVTDAPFFATASPPAGTTLVPHTQACAVEGGTCSESWIGSKLQWEIPADTAAGLAFTFSFTVSLPTGVTASAIVPRLTFSGPGCQVQPACTFDAPLVAAVDQSGAGGATAGTSPTVSTTPPVTDNQNLEVVVPSCKVVGSKPNDKTRVKCSGSTGPGSPAPGKAKLSSGSGEAFTTERPRPPSALANTGDDVIPSIKAGLLSVAAGAVLVLTSRLCRRRQADGRALSKPREEEFLRPASIRVGASLKA